MKKSSFIYLLLFTLLFGQIGINFFHSKHTDHTQQQRIPLDQDAISSYGEQCDVCAIDCLHGLVFQEANSFLFVSYHASFCSSPIETTYHAVVEFFNNRAPPALLS